jgi:TonB family protein
MIEAVSDIIAARSREPEGLNRMIALSVAAHVVVVAVLMFAPKPDFSDDAPRTVMTISLGGAPGPRSGGMTQMGGRAVQAAQPLESRRSRAEPAPAPKAPEMSLPRPDARPRPPQARPAQAPQESTARTPSTGPEPREGTARAETGARGRGFGLTTGGGGGAGAQLDVANFCCPEYVATFVQRIQQNWNQNQGVTAEVVVKFTIQRDGTMTDVQVEKPSGFIALDMAAQRAVLATARLPPLPAQFTNPTLTVHLTFDYSR